ncbi:MAG: hypothetical protein RJA31_90 [Actinomycetota bacterium]|jgi:hypothetical protein
MAQQFIDPESEPDEEPEPEIERHRRVRDVEFFDAQPTPRAELPEPSDVVERLALLACEILAGARNLDQISRWVTDDVYRQVAERSIRARRQRALTTNESLKRPTVMVMSSHLCEPRDGIVEGVALVKIGPRTRAVAVRLEGLDRRWRASSLALL